MEKNTGDRLRLRITSPRFTPADKTVIHHYHPQPSKLSHERVKILNWNVAKKNYRDAWMREFVALLEQYNPDIIPAFITIMLPLPPDREPGELLNVFWRGDLSSRGCGQWSKR